MEVKLKDFYKTLKINSYIVIKWLLISLLSGGICGLVGLAFFYSLKFVTELRTLKPYLIFSLPFLGLLIVFFYKATKVQKPRGTNLILDSLHSNEEIPLKMAPLIFVSTVLTHLGGGSAGREGAALQLGGSIGAGIGRFLKLTDDDIKIVTMSGMSALFTALFGTPLTASVFSIEVCSVGTFYYTAFFPCIIASLTAFHITNFFSINYGSYMVEKLFEIKYSDYFKLGILIILCSFVSMLFIIILHKVSELFQKYFNDFYLRIFIGGCIVVAFTIVYGNFDYNGAGMDMVKRALSNDMPSYAFLLKIILTSITIGSGFKGGEIVPSFFIGATFGNFIAGLLGFNIALGAQLGLVSIFVGVVNCPLSGIILGVELFGSQNILLFALAAAVSYILSGYYSLYSSQKIIYTKLPKHKAKANFKQKRLK
ncbi:H+/Cl-antiporter ClcA [Acetitomaculum ruminis DSM 5522]|uniref:H+/Cl-antiporter ClcA n=1 Tax=Acetitomaculum ruminis DSM 5522 TaxID=1120918 RepID=A0A1I0YHK6_9FIRM|nr:chloride channel protein [Acetitomaculum ruminis]SFB12632.1 H+/Cl-antiporter ClcA [Acetitomaculum ruminis DSM 5522]